MVDREGAPGDFRITPLEHLLFGGTLEPRDGMLVPDPSRPGLGLELKEADASRYRHGG